VAALEAVEAEAVAALEAEAVGAEAEAEAAEAVVVAEELLQMRCPMDVEEAGRLATIDEAKAVKEGDVLDIFLSPTEWHSAVVIATNQVR
jgi:hypothetical protein